VEHPSGTGCNKNHQPPPTSDESTTPSLFPNPQAQISRATPAQANVVASFTFEMDFSLGCLLPIMFLFKIRSLH
jgi:hypothetical protein